LKNIRFSLFLLLGWSGAFGGGFLPIKEVQGYYLVKETDNIKADTTFEIWFVNLNVIKIEDTVKNIQIIKTETKKGPNSTFSILSSSSQECNRSIHTCRFEIRGDSVKVEFIQQRVTTLRFKINGESGLKTFEGSVSHHKLNPDDNLNEKIYAERIDKNIALSF
jgi:hypothetical protein